MTHERGPEAPAHGLAVESALNVGKGVLHLLTVGRAVGQDILMVARHQDISGVSFIKREPELAGSK